MAKFIPRQGLEETRQLRQQHAGNPAMQQQLVQDDRYWQGQAAGSASLATALGELTLSLPYDALKQLYFRPETATSMLPLPLQKPASVSLRQGLEALTRRMLPGEGFNMQTTSRPSLESYGAYLSGALDGLKERQR